jgi:hypothetical protein
MPATPRSPKARSKRRPKGSDRPRADASPAAPSQAAAPLAAPGASSAAPVGQMARQTQLGAGFDTAILPFEPQTSDRFVYSQSFSPLALGGELQKPIIMRRSGIAVAAGAPKGLAALESQFASTIGLLFLDRTRIVPIESVLGEELMSLSLAPGETVVLEQQTFSKKTVSFEEQNEASQEYSLQSDSTLTTALEDGLTNQQQNSNKTTAGISGTIGGKFGPVTASVTPDFSNSVASADTSTQQHSVKNTRTLSTKVSSTYRAQHKTVMRISTERTFQNTSTRTLHNPNRFTPIDLRYFKIYQRLQLSLERYGVRLAWAPTIAWPGAAVLEEARQAQREVIQAAVNATSLPAPPVHPVPPPTLLTQVVGGPSSGPVKFKPGLSVGWTQGVSADEVVTLPIPSGFEWNKQPPALKVSEPHGSSGAFNGGVTITPPPYVDSSGNLVVPLHAGYPNNVEVEVTVTAEFVQIPPAVDAAYQAELAHYNQELAGYTAQVAALQAAAAAGAEQSAKEAYVAVVDNAEPLGVCIAQVIDSDLPQTVRAEPALIDVWTTLFDWSGATVQLYPAWWTPNQAGTLKLSDPAEPPTSFINASWARLYLPIVPGMEIPALEAISAVQGGFGTSAALAKLVKELKTYRTQTFGSETETPLGQPAPGARCPPALDEYQCLATWTELLPTEGTHLEVLQASTSAQDEVSAGEIEAREALTGSETALLSEIASEGGDNQVSVSLLLGDRPRRTETAGEAPSG